jgi:hypothetical protein
LPFSHEIFRERVFFDGMERVYWSFLPMGIFAWISSTTLL